MQDVVAIVPLLLDLPACELIAHLRATRALEHSASGPVACVVALPPLMGAVVIATPQVHGAARRVRCASSARVGLRWGFNPQAGRSSRSGARAAAWSHGRCRCTTQPARNLRRVGRGRTSG